MNKSKMFVWLIPLLFAGNIAIAQKELDPYLEMAAKNNPGLKATFNQYLANLEKVPQVGALPDPQVMFGIFAQPVETRVGAQRANISVSQAFPWFGTLGAREEAATMMAKASYEQFKDAKLKIFFEVKSIYYDLYYIQKAIEITEENLELLGTFRQLAQVGFESGRSGFVDVLRVEMEWEDLHTKLLYMRDSRQPIVAKFEELLNTTLGHEVNFPDTLWVENIEMPKGGLVEGILANSPVLKQLDFESRSYASQTEVARKMGLPSFTLGFSYTNIAPRTGMTDPPSDNGKDAFVFPQVGVRIPLWRDKYKAMVKENEIKQEAVDFSRENTENKLITALEKVHRDYLDAVRRVALNRKQAGYADRSLDLLTTEYSTEGKNFEEVIRMERRWLNYTLELEKARVEQNSFAAYINYLIGQ